MINFFDLTFAALTELLGRENVKAGHARDLWRHIYRPLHGSSVDQEGKSSGLKNWLKDKVSFSSPLMTEDIRCSRDGSQKFLFRTQDDLLIETVYIPQGKRRTLCLSSQAGRPWGCRFCATGAMGFKRNLTVAEMIFQFLIIKERLQSEISNLVFMGMGEPLSNFEQLKDSLDIFSHPLGISLPPRRITISTIGLLEPIRQIIEQRWKSSLAVSLHHHNQLRREELMPGTRAAPLHDLMPLLERYTRELNRPVFFEYLLLSEVNDSLKDAEALVALLSVLPSRINLIHFHPCEPAPFSPSSAQREEAFYRYLQNAGMPVIFRKSRGEDIFAACGQLTGIQDN